jgi:hypothetical protein
MVKKPIDFFLGIDKAVVILIGKDKNLMDFFYAQNHPLSGAG